MSTPPSDTKHGFYQYIQIAALFVGVLTNFSAQAQNNAATQKKVDETQIIGTDTETTETTAAPPKPATPNLPVPKRLNQQQQNLLAALTSPPSPTWLEVANEKVLGFWQPDLSGQPLGAVLLLHDSGDSPLSPQILNLHQFLPIEGWATLSIELPPSAPSIIPKRSPPINAPTITSLESPSPENSDKTQQKKDSSVDETQVVHDDTTTAPQTPPESATPNEGSSTEQSERKPTADEVLQQSLANIQAGIDYLNSQGQYNIIIYGEGLGALRTLQYAQRSNKAPAPVIDKKSPDSNATAIIQRAIRAIILLNLQNSFQGHKDQSMDLLSYQNIPTLDIYSKIDGEYKKEVKARRLRAQKNKLSPYRQKRLMPLTETPSIDTETQLTKSIRGFLNQYAKGKTL